MRIGVCTGGGDCPGLNAALRAVVKSAISVHGMEVVGIKESFNGLYQRPFGVRPLTMESVKDILPRGGTIIGTYNRGNPYVGKEREKLLELTVKGYQELGLDGLIVIGGEGTQGIARQLIDAGVNIVGVPKTIDNDLPGTDQTIGFSTCVDLVAESVERLHSTAEAHDRIMVLEVMGRDSGYIALHGGLAGGAHVILIPEIPFQFEPICKRIKERQDIGRNFSLVVVSEGAHEQGSRASYHAASSGVKNLGGIGELVAKKLFELTKLDTRYTVLGHLQRGGSPNATDRVLATQFGVRAVELVAKNQFNRLVVLRNGRVTDISYQDISPSVRQKIPLDDAVLKSAEAIGISVGR